MENLENLKNIISAFIKKDPSLITQETIIDNSVVQGSILINRMYSKIKEVTDIKITDYYAIHTFEDLLVTLGFKESSGPRIETIKPKKTDNFNKDEFSIGIDIEFKINLPVVKDIAQDIFYNENFSEKEIAYCLEQADTYLSLAGKFAAKEALIKTDQRLKGLPLKQIEILNDSSGKPYFKDYKISISHQNDMAVAVALFIPRK